jgi:hypothetical protein
MHTYINIYTCSYIDVYLYIYISLTPPTCEKVILIETFKIKYEDESLGYRKIPIESNANKLTKQEKNILKRDFKDERGIVKIPILPKTSENHIPLNAWSKPKVTRNSQGRSSQYFASRDLEMGRQSNRR